MTVPAPLRRPRLLQALSLALVSSAPLAMPQQPLKITSCFELHLAVEEFLAAEDDAACRTAFTSVADHWKHAIPKDFDELDEGPAIAARQATMRGIMLRPDLVEFLRQLVRQPSGQGAEPLALAAALLGDRGHGEDVQALLEGFAASDPSASVLPALGRNLGRAVVLARQSSADDTVIGGALQTLRDTLTVPGAFTLAAAIEGLFRADQIEDSLPPLERVLFDEHVDALKALKLLDGCLHLLKQPSLDPAIVRRANELARQAVSDVLAGKAAVSATAVAGFSHAGNLLDAAVNVFRVTAGMAEWDLLVRCYRSEAALDLLGIDALQHLRLVLQRLRKSATKEQRADLDSLFFTILASAGERLFQLEESPMDSAEYQRFMAKRNLRYNGAAYFTSQWSDEPSVREAWLHEADAPNLLAMLVRAADEQAEKDGTAMHYRAVKDKLETRVLCARLLAKLELSSKERASDLDLKSYFLRTMAEEIGAAMPPVLEAMAALDAAHASCLKVAMKKTREPPDTYVRDCASLGLEDLGYRVHITSHGLEITKRDAAAPAED